MKKISYRIYYAIAIVWYISGIMHLLYDESMGMSMTQLCVGSVFLCLASAKKKRIAQEEKEDKK